MLYHPCLGRGDLGSEQLTEQTGVNGVWGEDAPDRASNTGESLEVQKLVFANRARRELFGFTQMLVAMGTSLRLILLQLLQKPGLRRHLVAASDANLAEKAAGVKSSPHPSPLNCLFLSLSLDMDLL